MGIDMGAMEILSLVGTGLSAISGLAQGNAAAQSANYNAAVARQNAQLERQRAIWAGQAGEAQAAQVGMKARQRAGAIIANQAAGNIDVTTGSAPDVVTSEKQLGELDAMTARSNATREAYGYNVAATSDLNQANLDAYQAQSAQTAGALTFLGGAATGTSNWLKYQNSTGLSVEPASTMTMGAAGNNPYAY